jgi:hypothetical protein
LVVHQRAAVLTEFRICPACESLVQEERSLAQVGRALSLGFDHYAPVDEPGIVGIGVEVFPAEAGDMPRRFAILREAEGGYTVEAETTFEASTLTTWLHGSAVAVAVLDAVEGALYAGFLNGGNLDLRVRLVTDWKFHELPTPRRSSLFTQPDVRGAHLLARSTPKGSEVIAYDGFQMLIAELSPNLSSGAVTTHMVHGVRDDRAY